MRSTEARNDGQDNRTDALGQDKTAAPMSDMSGADWETISHGECPTQTAIAIEVDTAALRRKAKDGSDQQSDSAPSEVQKRLESWSPKGADSRSLCGRIEDASTRRDQLVEERSAARARHHAKVEKVAQRYKDQQLQDKAALLAAQATKLGSAALKRKTTLHTTSATAGSHFEHAKEVAAEQRVRKQQKINNQKARLKYREQGARRRVLAALQDFHVRMESFNRRQAAAASNKTAHIDKLKAQSKAKLEATTLRHEKLRFEMLNKLSLNSLRSRQVRCNKGSTPTRATAAAERTVADRMKPCAFEIDIKNGHSQTNKSPIQARLEQRTRSAVPDTAQMSHNRLQEATARRLEFEERKLVPVIAHNTRVATIAASHRTKPQFEMLKAKEQLQSKQTEAAVRRGAKLGLLSQKNADRFQHAREVSISTKATVQMTTCRQQSHMEVASAAAAQRRQKIQAKTAERAAAFAQSWSPKRAQFSCLQVH